MNELENKALLPAGLRDIFPRSREGAYEKRWLEPWPWLLVPPLVEFEDLPAALELRYRRIRFVCWIRFSADDGGAGGYDTQVARIAANWRVTRPGSRLSYTGEVLRIRLAAPSRGQFAQVGAELIGTKSAAADRSLKLLLMLRKKVFLTCR